MNLGDALRKKGLKKLPQRKPCPVPLRPEILIHPNIPKPLHGVNPRTIMGTNWWNRERRKVYKSTEFHCIACGVHKDDARSRQWMEAHETYSIDYLKGRATYIETVPLCHFCHNFIHSGRLQALLDSGKLHHSKFVAIIQHGDRVLRAAGLEKKSHFEREAEVKKLIRQGLIADWEDWRLIFDGKEHEPIYKTYEQWLAAMTEGVNEDE